MNVFVYCLYCGEKIEHGREEHLKKVHGLTNNDIHKISEHMHSSKPDTLLPVPPKGEFWELNMETWKWRLKNG